MKIKSFIIAMMIVILQTLTIAAETEADYFEEIGDGATMNWTTKSLRVKGNGYGPERIKQLGRKKILAKRAARLDAYRNMVEAIKGVRVTSGTNVEDMVVQEDTIKTRTDGMLKGARVVDVTYTEDGGCEITMEVNIDQSGTFLLAALNDENVQITDNYPKFDWTALQKDLAKTKNRLANLNAAHTRAKRDIRSKDEQLKNKQTVIEDVQQQYAAASADLKKKGQELNAGNIQLARLEERLTATKTGKAQLETQMTAAQSEMQKTKKIIADLTTRLHSEEMKAALDGKELKQTKKFLAAKESELNKMSIEMKGYSDTAKSAQLDKERLLGYVRHIKEIQTETNNRLEPL
ncbi:MAG: hypothetical protein GY757_60915, partial [bacterium]|nr:hypothetical protein [bacterium]